MIIKFAKEPMVRERWLGPPDNVSVSMQITDPQTLDEIADEFYNFVGACGYMNAYEDHRKRVEDFNDCTECDVIKERDAAWLEIEKLEARVLELEQKIKEMEAS